jgi:hypothetical protein
MGTILIKRLVIKDTSMFWAHYLSGAVSSKRLLVFYKTAQVFIYLLSCIRLLRQQCKKKTETGSLNNRHLLFHSSRGRMSKIKMLTDLLSPEASQLVF